MSPVSIIFSTVIRFKIDKYTYRISKNHQKRPTIHFFSINMIQDIKISKSKTNNPTSPGTEKNAPKRLKIPQNRSKFSKTLKNGIKNP
jgi:hypothetical protein